MRKKNKSIYIVLIVTLLICITIGYSVLNSTLNINGKSTIQKNTWDVHFENIKVTDGSVTATVDPVILNNTSISNFEITLDKPGDFYAFTVDVVNDGSIDAMIDSVLKTPDLTNAQQKYLNYIIEYQNGEQTTTKQLVKSEEFVRLKVRVEYKKDITASDLPITVDTLNLGFTVNYVQSDGTGIKVPDDGVYYPVKIISGDYDTVGSEIAIGDEHFYVISSDEDSVTMLSKLNISTESIPKQTNQVDLVFFALENYWADYSDDISRCTLKSKYGDDFFIHSGVPIYVYDSNSIQYEYIEKYKTYLESHRAVVEEARLIKIEELEALGCSFESGTCSNAPEWVYDKSDDAYATGSVYGCNSIFTIDSIGNLAATSYNYELERNIRPVITIKKVYYGNDTESGNTSNEEKVVIANGDINEIGTIVTIGTEKFYTIGTDSENVILLSMYNLYVGGSHPPNGNYTPYGDEATVMQEKNMNGRHDGLTVFSNVGTSYSGSVVEEYVDNYKSLLESKFGINIAEARLITSEELFNPQTFACEVPDYVGSFFDSYGSCSDEYPWIYEIGYWIKDFYDDRYNWAIEQYEGIMTASYTYYNGVRPVIVISKDYF